MAKSDDSVDESDEDEMLPDEREAIAKRLDSLDESERRSLSDIVDALEEQ